MHTGAAVPLVALGTAMSDAIVEMTAKGFGCVGITDARRAASPASSPTATCAGTCAPTCSTPRVDDVMTREPKTVRPDQLVSEALELLNSSKITAVIVVEAGKPVGIVHLHDLLRAAGVGSRRVGIVSQMLATLITRQAGSASSTGPAITLRQPLHHQVAHPRARP